jgi:hypothetical protein
VGHEFRRSFIGDITQITIRDRENPKQNDFHQRCRAFGLQKNHQHHVDADGSEVPVTLNFSR